MPAHEPPPQAFRIAFRLNPTDLTVRCGVRHDCRFSELQMVPQPFQPGPGEQGTKVVRRGMNAQALAQPGAAFVEVGEAHADPVPALCHQGLVELAEEHAHELRRGKFRVRSQANVEVVVHGLLLFGFTEHAATDQVGDHIMLLLHGGRLVAQYPVVEQRIEGDRLCPGM